MAFSSPHHQAYASVLFLLYLKFKLSIQAALSISKSINTKILVLSIALVETLGNYYIRPYIYPDYLP